MIRILLCLAITFTCCGVSESATYYVRKSGNNKNDGRSKNQAFQTIGHAASFAIAGDLIVVGAGTYDERIDWKLDSKSDVFSILMGDTAGTQTGDKGEIVIRPPSNSWALNTPNHSSLMIMRITFAKNPANTGASYGCNMAGGQGVAFFSNCRFEGLGFGVRRDNAVGDMQLSRCTFDDCSYGCYSSRARTVTAMQCKFFGNYIALHTSDCHKTVSTSCEFFSTSIKGDKPQRYFGVYALRTPVDVTDCQFDTAQYGVYGFDVTAANVKGCSFTDSVGYGVSCTGQKLVAEDCKFSGGTYGIALNDTAGERGQITNCGFEGLSVGVYAPGSDYDFQGASISGCTYGIYTYNGTKTFRIDRTSKFELKGNKVGLYCNHIAKEPFLLDVEGHDFSGNAVGLRSYGAPARIVQCQFACESTGLQIQRTTSVEIRSCKFLGNEADPTTSVYGLYLEADKISMRDCFSTNSRYGYYIHNQSDGTPELKNVVADKNINCGLYMNKGSWAWTAGDGNAFTNSSAGVRTQYVDWKIDGIKHGDSCDYAIMEYYGNLKVSNSKLTGKYAAIYAYKSESLHASNTAVVDGNYGIMAYYTKTGSFDKLTVSGNQTGLYWYNQEGDDVLITNSTFSKNARDAVNLYFVGLAKGSRDLQIEGNGGIGLRVYDKDVVLTGDMNIQLSDNNIGLHVQLGSTSVSKLAMKGNNIPIYAYDGPLEVRDCELSGKTYGVLGYVKGKATIENCKISDASFGLYLLPREELAEAMKISNVTVASAPSYGIYVRGTTGLKNQVDISNCTLQDCNYGLYTLSMLTTAQHLQITGSKTRAVHTQGGTMSLADTNIKGSGSWAIYAAGDEDKIERTTIAGAAHGVYFYTLKGSLVNSVIRDASYGVYMYNNNGADYQILQSTIANIKHYGIWLDGGTALVRNCVVDAGVYGMYKNATRGTLNHDYNLVYSPSRPYINTSPDPTEISKQPIFVDAANGDLHLAAGSPAINAGTDLSKLIASDIEGNKRPSFRAYEMGAYEYMKPQGSLRVLQWDEVAK